MDLEKRRLRFIVILIVLVLATAAMIVLATGIGSVRIPAGEVMQVLWKKLMQLLRSVPFTEPVPHEIIVWNLRLPRALLAASVGASLAVAGGLMQGLLRNPMADPYVIGVSSGASVGAAAAFLLLGSIGWQTGLAITPLFAFAGAVAAVILVYLVARVGNRVPVITLLLSGIALNTVLSAVLSVLIYFTNRQLHALIYWLMGSFSARGWEHLAMVLPYLALGIGLALYVARDLNALSMGEEAAATLGVSVERTKVLVLLASTLLTAGAVAVSGIIGFVGLLVPHITRLLFGPDHRVLLPASALLGASFLVLADLLARSLLPNVEMPVGVITSLCGGPFFLFLLRRREVRGF